MPVWSDDQKRRFGPWAVVTGASDGIGRAIATELAHAGVNVVIVARRRAALEQLAGSLAAETGAAVRVMASDLSQPGAAAALESATTDLDVGLLVAAAGFGTSGPMLGLPVERELEMIDVNCRALTELAALYGRRLSARGRGGIVLMSSLLAFQGVAGAATYSATKAFVQTFAEGLRGELKPFGVEVLSAAPGPVRTGFAERADLRMSLADTPGAVARDILAALGRRGTVRPGPVSKLFAAALATAPRWLRVLILSRVMAGMTGHQGAAAPKAA